MSLVEPLTPGISQSGDDFAVDPEHEVFPLQSGVGVVGAVFLPQVLVVHTDIHTEPQKLV